MIFNEEDIDGSVYDEIEIFDGEVSIMRTLKNFKLQDSSGKLISFDDLNSEQLVTGVIYGAILEPMSKARRDTISSYMSTINVDQVYNTGAIKNSTNEYANAAPEFDRSSLTIGDNIDGFCNKTNTWYESKIVDTHITDEKKQMLKIHFKGWASKHDEWIERSSDRLAPLGGSKYYIMKAAKEISKMAPWYEAEQLHEMVNRKYDLVI